MEQLEDRNLLSADFGFAAGLGGTLDDVGTFAVTDAAGNIYTTGGFRGTADFDPGPGVFNLTSAGGQDVFVSKLDSSGNLVWTGAFRGNGLYDTGHAIAFDAGGNLYVAGLFAGTCDFDPGPGIANLTSAGSDDIFVAKLDSSGNFVWAQRIGGGGIDEGFDMQVDGAGNVVVTGLFQGTVDFDPGLGVYNLTSAGADDIFIAKLTSAGNFAWAKRIGGGGNDRGFGMALDATGNVYTTGFFNGTVDFDPGAGTFNLTSATSNEIFVSKLDSAGNFVWAQRTGGTPSALTNSIALDNAGNVYTTGLFSGTVDFDPGAGVFPLMSAGASDIVVSKLDGAGNFVWARAMGGIGADEGVGVAADGAGYVYTTGSFSGTADFDPSAGTFNLTSAGGNDIFVSQLTTSGDFVWAGNMGGSGNDLGWGLAADAAGRIVVTGGFLGTADFDPGPGTANLTSAGAYDIFVVQLKNPVLRFDLNHTGTPTAAGFTGIGTANAYDPMLGYGWQTTSPTFTSSGPDALLEDFHYGLAPNTFLADVPNGDYVVNLTMGYTAAGFHDVDVTAEGGSVFTGLGAPAGEFLHRSFTVHVGDGQLNLGFSNSAGSYYVVNAVEVRSAPANVITITGPGSQPADGTVDAFNATGAAPGALVTVTTDLGTITTADADPNYAGVQVVADGVGAFTFNVQRPFTPGMATITAEQVDAAAAGSTTQGYTGPSALRFDLNAAGSPTAFGFIGLGTSNAYSPVPGYGWLAATPTYSTVGPDDLLRDFHYSTSSNTFQVDLANGTYVVNVTMGYNLAGFDNVDISAEGNPELTGLGSTAGQFIHRSFTVTVADNQLNLLFTDTGGSAFFPVNAIEILTAPQNPLTLVGPTSGAADGTTVDNYTGSIATANSLVTISTDSGTPSGVDASAAYAGFQVLSNGSGDFSFNIQRPSTAGSATITAEEVSGASIGTLGVTYSGPLAQKFDFNHAGTLTAAGYTGVGTTNTYNAALGYGWTGGNSPTFSAAGPDTLLQDFHYGTSTNTFRVAVALGATYQVTPSFRYIVPVSGFDVSAEGMLKLDEVNVPANTTVSPSFMVTDGGDGFLDITFNTDGAPFYLINALDITYVPPLHAAVAPAATPTTETLTADQLSPIVAEAISRWSTVVPDAAQTLAGVEVQIASLSGNTLGLASGQTITIDADAAGYGWFVDVTPDDNVEFDATGSALAADAVDHFDLLTVVMHEFGHVLGYDDIDPAAASDALMNGALPLSTRRSLAPPHVDAVFASAAATSAGSPTSNLPSGSETSFHGLSSWGAEREAYWAFVENGPRRTDAAANDRFFADFDIDCNNKH